MKRQSLSIPPVLIPGEEFWPARSRGSHEVIQLPIGAANVFNPKLQEAVSEAPWLIRGEMPVHRFLYVVLNIGGAVAPVILVLMLGVYLQVGPREYWQLLDTGVGLHPVLVDGLVVLYGIALLGMLRGLLLQHRMVKQKISESQRVLSIDPRTFWGLMIAACWPLLIVPASMVNLLFFDSPSDKDLQLFLMVFPGLPTVTSVVLCMLGSYYQRWNRYYTRLRQ